MAPSFVEVGSCSGQLCSPRSSFSFQSPMSYLPRLWASLQAAQILLNSRSHRAGQRSRCIWSVTRTHDPIPPVTLGWGNELLCVASNKRPYTFPCVNYTTDCLILQTSSLAGFQDNYTTPSPVLPAIAQEQLSCEADELRHHPTRGELLVTACKAGAPHGGPEFLHWFGSMS